MSPSPFYGTTSRWALRKLLGTSNGSDIDAGFDALATDIDNLPLSLLPASMSGSTATAIDGQMLSCTGAAQAITLPSSAKGMLGVRAGGTQTGANPVTITGAGGALIKGAGHSSGVASIALGAPGASVVLLFDGTNWQVIAGARDTGWIVLAVPSGFTTTTVISRGDAPVALRLIGNRVYVRGAADNNTGGTVTYSENLPTGFSPPFNARAQEGGGNVSGYAAPLAFSGTPGTLGHQSIAVGGTAIFDGFTWTVD